MLATAPTDWARGLPTNTIATRYRLCGPATPDRRRPGLAPATKGATPAAGAPNSRNGGGPPAGSPR
eukprot:11186450-Lingulodinium_polyedra.AAC.1